MDLQLRFISSHPKAASFPTLYALSTRYPRLVTVAGDILIDQSTSSSAIRASIRTSAYVDKIVYVGATATFLVFLQNGCVASYAEHSSTLYFVDEVRIDAAGRSVTMAHGSHFGRFAIFVKEDSPSLWCLPVADNSFLSTPFKLRSDIEGDQDKIKFVDGVFAKVRGKVATKPKSKICPITAIATHPNLPFVAAAYTNGIIRVWNVAQKQQRNHCDAQLLLHERVLDIAIHPFLPVIVLCTNLGRLLTFQTINGMYKHGDDPVLPSSRTKEKKRRFRAMCFMTGSPAYLLLLTTSSRILVRIINRSFMIVSSNRYSKMSKVLPTDGNANANASQLPSKFPDMNQLDLHNRQPATLSYESAFGLIACTLDRSKNVYIFQRVVDGLPGIQRHFSSGLDAGFSKAPGNSFKGPIVVDSESLIVKSNTLFLYELGKERVSTLCNLPKGDVRQLEVARDEYGRCQGALVFYYGDNEMSSNAYVEFEHPARYVLCTRGSDAEGWNASEPSEGQSGCFLNAAGHHDRLIILSQSGTSASLLSFGTSSNVLNGRPVRRSRGVQRFKFERGKASKVFRTPFASWSAVLYHDAEGNMLTISENAFDQSEAGLDSEKKSFDMDRRTGLVLLDEEIVLDVRWQEVPDHRHRMQFLGAIMTNRRIYFIQDILNLYSKFELQSISRMVVPFTPPSISWVGPSLMLLYGNSLFSVSIDAGVDLIAGLSHSENATVLVAALADRIIYARPSPDSDESVSITSRPYGALSGLVRGILSLPKSRTWDESACVETVKQVLESQDVSQGSFEVTDSLINNNLAPMAYLLAASTQGQYIIPPLKRATFLGRIGDIRGALSTAESEYFRLPSIEFFHKGTELFRLLQRILNMALVSGDFVVGRRCSALLGKQGTFSAFVDSEGGHEAVRMIMEFAHVNRHGHMGDFMRPLLEKSLSSSIATDSSLMASGRELNKLKKAVLGMAPGSIPLGMEDKFEIFIKVAPGDDEEGNTSQDKKIELVGVKACDVNERLEMMNRKSTIEVIGSETTTMYGDSEDMYSVSEVMDKPGAKANTGGAFPDDSSDEDGYDESGMFKNKDDNMEDGSGEQSVNNGSTVEMPSRSELEKAAQQQAAEAHQKLEQHQQETNKVLEQDKKEAHKALTTQWDAQATRVVGTRAPHFVERAMERFNEEKWSSAQKELEAAKRAMARGRERGVVTPQEQVNEVVYYQMVCRVRMALSEIGSSAHANTLPGRLTYSQLATAQTSYPLRLRHRIEALVLAIDAHMLLNNFGTAGQGMRLIKELGVPKDLRVSLRDKYAICSARGFVNNVQQNIQPLCFLTLEGINGRALSCTICPATFSVGPRIAIDTLCPCCGIGSIRLLV